MYCSMTSDIRLRLADFRELNKQGESSFEMTKTNPNYLVSFCTGQLATEDLMIFYR